MAAPLISGVKRLLSWGQARFLPIILLAAGSRLLFRGNFNGLHLAVQLNFVAVAYNSVVLVGFVGGYGGYLPSLYTLAQLKFPPGLYVALAGGLEANVAVSHSPFTGSYASFSISAAFTCCGFYEH
jgi:hypothetical protein